MMNSFLDYVLNFFKEREENKPWYNLYETGVTPSLNYPGGSMYDSFIECADKYPNVYAYKYFGKKVKFKKFKKQVINCAKALKSIGVKENDIVTICMPNTPEALIFFYGLPYNP